MQRQMCKKFGIRGPDWQRSRASINCLAGLLLYIAVARWVNDVRGRACCARPLPRGRVDRADRQTPLWSYGRAPCRGKLRDGAAFSADLAAPTVKSITYTLRRRAKGMISPVALTSM